MRRRKAEALLEARVGLASVLARRAEALTEKRKFRSRRWVASRTPWPIIEAACFIAGRRSRGWVGVRTIEPEQGVPSWALDVAVASNLGRGRREQRKGAGRRLALLLVIAKRLVAWDGGLRLEEMAAMLGCDEMRLWPTLQWAKREGVFADLGERGWFLPTWAEDRDRLRAA